MSGAEVRHCGKTYPILVYKNFPRLTGRKCCFMQALRESAKGMGSDDRFHRNQILIAHSFLRGN
jgi:hypothetical protein